MSCFHSLVQDFAAGANSSGYFDCIDPEENSPRGAGAQSKEFLIKTHSDLCELRVSAVKQGFLLWLQLSINGRWSSHYFLPVCSHRRSPGRNAASEALETEAQRDQQDAEEDEEAANQPHDCQGAGSGL